jgi:hypothetical protein
MRSRRIACLLLGIWMGAGLWMLWVASSNAASADRLLRAPNAAADAYLKSLGQVSLLPLTHYLAEQQNRSLFETWGVVQIALGAVLFFYLLFGTRLGKFPLAVSLLMLLIVIGERIAIGPGMEMVGRYADLNSDPSHRLQVAQGALDYGYKMAEALKFALGAIVAVYLIWQHTRSSSDARKQIDVINEPNYRHIDR